MTVIGIQGFRLAANSRLYAVVWQRRAAQTRDNAEIGTAGTCMLTLSIVGYFDRWVASSNYSWVASDNSRACNKPHELSSGQFDLSKGFGLVTSNKSPTESWQLPAIIKCTARRLHILTRDQANLD